MKVPPQLTQNLQRAPTQYVPIYRIAKGGMAEVWSAEAVFEDGESYPVAIKRVDPAFAQDATYRSMFEDEARLGMRLRHKGIVRVYDAREIEGALIMVMEFVDGVSLKMLLDVLQARGTRFPVAGALQIARAVAEALAYAHGATDARGRPLSVVHRDVSPHNVLLSKQGEVKLTDFGLADAAVHQTARDADMVVGKLGYLAPECIGEGDTDHRVDLFGLGVVLWEMLAGRSLFVDAKDPKQTVRNLVRLAPSPLAPEVAGVTPAIDAFLATLLAKDPARRAQRAQDAAVVLQGFQGEAGVGPGEREIALLVGLHCAQLGPAKAPRGLEGLAHELAAFVDSAGTPGASAGASALDPLDFGLPPGKGVKPPPSR